MKLIYIYLGLNLLTSFAYALDHHSCDISKIGVTSNHMAYVVCIRATSNGINTFGVSTSATTATNIIQTITSAYAGSKTLYIRYDSSSSSTKPDGCNSTCASISSIEGDL